MTDAAEIVPPSPVYRAAMTVCGPLISGWGRLEVAGLQTLPASGPLLLVGNHDSNWDPVAIGRAALGRRQIKALAKSSLWKFGPLGWVLDGMGQVPVDRGAGDTHALDRAVAELAGGSCIGVFPEGTISRGQALRARSGAGRLALSVPGIQVACVRVSGTVDIVRFPQRPRIRVEFFLPEGGPPKPGETASAFTLRVMEEIRSEAPHTIPGRRRTAEKYRRALEEA
jgi:1-acyl-sn-glycerol-3-phosphate acyltransferase